MKKNKKILILGEFYRPLGQWFLKDESPTGVPAVYELYSYLGESVNFTFHSVIYNPKLNRQKSFPNGSLIEMKKFKFPVYYLWKLIVFIKLYFYSVSLVKKNDYDCIYGLSSFATIASLIGRQFGIKSVGRIYGTILTKPVKNRNYLKLYTRHLFDVISIKIPADHVIATQDGTEYDKVFGFFNPRFKVTMLFNGIDIGLKDKLKSLPNVVLLPEKETIKFLYVARLESYKRQEISIEIVRQLVTNHNRKNIHLHIIGTGSRKSALTEMILNYTLQEYITISDELAHEQITELLQSAHASLFFYEGGSLGNIMWESALAGRLIITIDNGGTGTVFKDEINSLILPEGSNFAKEMAAKIESKIGTDISQITEKGRVQVSKLIQGWDKRFKKEFDMIFK